MDPAKDQEGLGHSAYVSIRDRIVSLEIEPGSLLSENTLGAALGQSRTPIREALRRLEREYLVTIMPRRGILVTEVDVKTQLQLIEFRRGTETRLIRRGTQRSTESQRQKFADLANQMAQATERGSLTEYIELDNDFDREIDVAAENRFLTDAMKPVHALVRRFWHTQLGKPGLHKALNMHIDVVRAASEGNAEAACDALNTLLNFNEKYLHELLS